MQRRRIPEEIGFAQAVAVAVISKSTFSSAIATIAFKFTSFFGIASHKNFILEAKLWNI